MKKTILMMLLFACLIPFSMVNGQNQKTPNWINGTWENSLISDLGNSVAWTFNHDSIFIEKGSPITRKKKCLSLDYPGYKESQFSEDNLYRVTFSKDNDTAVYEFKLWSTSTIDKPVLTYSLTVNGIKKVDHSKSAYLEFFKREIIPLMLTPMKD